MYIWLILRANNPPGSKFWWQQKASVTLNHVLLIQERSLTSWILYRIFHDFIHSCSPWARTPRDKILMSMNSFVTFCLLLQVSNFISTMKVLGWSQVSTLPIFQESTEFFGNFWPPVASFQHIIDMKVLVWSHHFFFFFLRIKGMYSEKVAWIWRLFKLMQDLMNVVVTCKYHEEKVLVKHFT